MPDIPKPEVYHKLRDRYPTFVYEGYHINEKGSAIELSWDFSLTKDLRFKPTLLIPHIPDHLNTKHGRYVLRMLAFHIGMVELVSYWKATCSPRIIVRPHSLSASATRFWEELYFMGLGEFRYLNGISAEAASFLHISSEGPPVSEMNFSVDPGRILVPVGGGKDSAVSLNLLNHHPAEIIPFMINPLPASWRTIDATGTDRANALVFERKLDPQLIELNKEGYLNGHTPFSALVAFNTLLASFLKGAGHVALSNESSANEATVPGTDINHQYSKSFEFESLFRSYCRDELKISTNYFSFLRPLNELQIASIFSRLPEYHSIFRSCNVGSKQDRWCGNCPKCLFTTLILAPFLNDTELSAITGKNILDDQSLVQWLDELAGWAEIKPFECVGTIDEVREALRLAIGKREGTDLPALLSYAAGNLGNTNKVVESGLISTVSSKHNLDAPLLNILKQAIENGSRDD